MECLGETDEARAQKRGQKRWESSDKDPCEEMQQETI